MPLNVQKPEVGIGSKDYEESLRREMKGGQSYFSYFADDSTSTDAYKRSSPNKTNSSGPNLSSVRDLHRQIANIKFDNE